MSKEKKMRPRPYELADSIRLDHLFKIWDGEEIEARFTLVQGVTGVFLTITSGRGVITYQGRAEGVWLHSGAPVDSWKKTE